jgi:acyl carrier protein
MPPAPVPRIAGDGAEIPRPADHRGGDLRALLSAAPSAERPRLLRDHVRTIIARILGWPEGELPPETAPLREIGLDSLMSVELRNALAAACATRLPATLVFEHPTAAALAEHLGGTVFAGLMPGAGDALEDGLDALDADALARLLEAELSAAGEQLAGRP